MLKKLKNWLKRKKKWQPTNADFIGDFNAMKQALEKNQNILYLKDRMAGKSTIFNNIVAEFEAATGTKLEDWQYEIFLDQVGLANKSFYRNLRTGQIVFDKQPISETDMVNLHTKAENENHRFTIVKHEDYGFCGFLDEQQLLDKEFLEKAAKQLNSQSKFYPITPPNTPSRANTITGAWEGQTNGKQVVEDLKTMQETFEENMKKHGIELQPVKLTKEEYEAFKDEYTLYSGNILTKKKKKD